MTGTTLTASPTELQEAAWWVGQRAKDDSVHHITWRLACDAPIDVAALRVAWQAVTDRHEALRMSIALRDGKLETRIAPRVTTDVQVIEISDPGTAQVDTLLRMIAEESHRQAFPLDRAPLARLAVITVHDTRELMLTAHHIAVDGWAIQLLFTDLSSAYHSAARGLRPAFDTETPSWHEYAREQEEARAAGGWRSSIDYWRKKLSGAVGTTVAGDRTRYAAAGAPGAILRHTFSTAAAEGLTALAKSTGATSFAVVLASLQILLARSGSGADVTVGVVTANRMSARDQELVGYLANLCVIRATVSEQDALTDVVDRARGALWEMFAHQSVPYPAVISALPEPTRVALGDTSPLMLNYLGPISSGLRLGDVGLTMRESPNQAARTDIGIAYWDTENGITAEVEYSTVRYDRDTVLRLLRDLDAVLAAGTDGSLVVGEIRVRTRSTAARLDHGQPATPDQPRDGGDHGAANPARDTVSQVWTEVLGYPPESLDEDFFERGGHSLNAVEFIATLAEATGTQLAIETWLAEPTPRAILGQLGGQADAGAMAERQSTVVSLRPGTGRHLHLFTGAGGTAQNYRELVGALPGDWRITLSQEREPLDGIAAAAARFRADLDAEGLRPDLVAGWSMGGLIAFELASGYGDAAPGVVLVDSPPPASGGDLAAVPVWQRLGHFAATVCLALGVRLAGSPLTGPADTDDTVRTALLTLSARLRAAGHDVPTQALVERWHTYRRHAAAATVYLSNRVLPAPGVVVAADLPDSGVAAWADRFTHAPEVVRLAADHYSVLRTPVVAVVAAAMERMAAPVGSSTLG